MKIQQLSLFVENKPGRLSAATRALAEAEVNILTLSLADTQQFGILRLIVRDPDRARKVLEDTGHVVKVTEVVAIEVSDRPGGLTRILEVLESGTINIEYMYAFTYRSDASAVLVFRFDDPDAAIALLQEKGINVIAPVDLYKRVDA